MAKTILVTKRSVQDEHENVKLEKAPAIVQNVVAEFIDGTVKTSSGDIWMAKPCEGKKGKPPLADLVAVF